MSAIELESVELTTTLEMSVPFASRDWRKARGSLSIGFSSLWIRDEVAAAEAMSEKEARSAEICIVEAWRSM